MRILKYILISLTLFFVLPITSHAQTIDIHAVCPDQNQDAHYIIELPDDFICVGYPVSHWSGLPSVALAFSRNNSDGLYNAVNANLPSNFITSIGNHPFPMGGILYSTNNHDLLVWGGLPTEAWSNLYWISYDGAIMFDSQAEALAAVQSWNFVAFDPNLPFDFSDPYDANLGVPKITNLTYDGVTFENTDNREIEVMYKFDFYGWQYDSSRADWVKPDYNNLIQSAKGNYVGKGSNYNGFVSFDTFGGELDIIKAASIAYNTSLRIDSVTRNIDFSKIPGFKWYNSFSFALEQITTSQQSLIDHVWLDNINSAQAYFKPYQNLNLQFFARYVGGQWVQYNMIYPVVNSATVTGSTGGTTSTGDQIPQTEDPQTMETKDGGLTWEIIQNVNKVVLPGVDKYDVSVLQNAVNDYKNFLGQFPLLINYVFPFIPSWLTSWIAIAIAFSCVVAVIRLIRG